MKAKRPQNTETYPQLENVYDTLNIAFVGAEVDWASLKVNKNHRTFTPIYFKKLNKLRAGRGTKPKPLRFLVHGCTSAYPIVLAKAKRW